MGREPSPEYRELRQKIMRVVCPSNDLSDELRTAIATTFVVWKLFMEGIVSSQILILFSSRVGSRLEQEASVDLSI